MKTTTYEALVALERHTGIIRIMLILLDEAEVNFQRFIDDFNFSSTTLYRTISQLKSIDLVKSRIDNTSYPARNMISLTTKGKKVAELLKKIEEVLEG